MNNNLSKILVRFYPGSAGHFLSSFIHSLQTEININHINAHAHHEASYNHWHTVSSICEGQFPEWAKNKISTISTSIDDKNILGQILYNPHFELISNESKEKIKSKILFNKLPENLKFWIFNSHTYDYEVFDFLENFKVISIVFEENDIPKIKFNAYLKLNLYMMSEGKKNLYENGVNLDFLKIKNKSENTKVMKYLDYIPPNNKNIPVLKVNFKDIMNGKISDIEYVKNLCEFIGIEFDEKFYKQSVKLLKRYLSSQVNNLLVK